MKARTGACVVIAALAAGLAGCLQAEVTACGDRICPGTQVCDDAHALCVFPEQLTACGPLPAGAPCAIGGVEGAGVCTDGVCLQPLCGDAVILGSEECDGSELAGWDCSDLGFQGGTLACTASCTYDVSDCDGRCRDEMINGNEDCDCGDVGTECTSAALGGLSCLDFGFYVAGGLGCSGACTYDVSDCEQRCGDQIRNGGELCDGAPPELFCSDVGYDGGTLECTNLCSPDPRGCTLVGFREVLSPTNEVLRAVWGTSASSVFAVGDAGVILRRDNVGWTLAATTTGQLNAVHGTSATDVWAVGQGGRIHHWNGTALSTTIAPGFNGTLSDVWAVAPDDVFAVGVQGKIFHYDGATWTAMASGTTDSLVSVWASGPDDVYAVNSFLGAAVVHHYDGVAWSALTTLSTGMLSAVWGTGPDDVYVLDDNSDLAWHYDGASWSPLPAGPLFVAGSIWGRGAGDLWLVGSAGGIWHSSDDGAWVPVTPTVSSELMAVWVSAEGRLFAVGGGGTIVQGSMEIGAQDDGAGAVGDEVAITGARADQVLVAGVERVRRLAGDRWETVGTGLDATDVAVGPTGEVYVVGSQQESLHQEAGLWVSHDDHTANLNAVWTPAPGVAYGVGAGGRIERFVLGDWQSMSSPTSFVLNDVGGTHPSDVYAVGVGGAILHFDGIAWTPMANSSTALEGVWASPTGPVFAVGQNGTIRRNQGGGWGGMTGVGTQALYAVWGTAADNVYAVGNSGTILRFDGSTWSAMASPVTTALRAVWGRSSSDIYAAGQDVVLHHDGTSWTVLASGLPGSITGLAGDAGSVVAVGADGLVLVDDGDGFAPAVAPITSSLICAWGPPGGDQFFAGTGDRVHVWDGTAVTAMPAVPAATVLTAMWGRSDDDFYVGGTNVAAGVVYHRVNNGWTTMAGMPNPQVSALWVGATGEPVAASWDLLVRWTGSAWQTEHTAVGPIHAMWGSALDDVWAVGDGGQILHRTVAGWATAPSPTGATLRRIWGSAADDIWAGGDDGALIHFDGVIWAPVRSPTFAKIQAMWGWPGEMVFSDVAGDLRRLVGRVP